MKTLREVFEENYLPVEEPCSNRRGFKIRYRYIGLWYVWNADVALVHAVKCRAGLFCAGSTAAYFFAAMHNSIVNDSRYVGLPGFLSLAVLIFEVIGVIQFCLSGDRMTNMDFWDVHTKLQVSTILHAVLLFCATLGCIYDIFIWGLPVYTAVIAGGYLLSGLFSLGILFNYRKIPYRKEKNEAVQKPI